jgi:hypothetical protein
MSYDSLDSRKRALDAISEAAIHVEKVDRPVLAMLMNGHPVWVVPAETQMDALLRAYSEPDPDLRAKAKRELLMGPAQGRRMGKPQGFRAVEKEQ